MKTQDRLWEAILAEIRRRSALPNENQSSIARLLGVERGTISRWLTGERGVSRQSLDKLIHYMNVLGMDPAPFFGGSAAAEKSGRADAPREAARLEEAVRRLEAEKEALVKELAAQKDVQVHLLRELHEAKDMLIQAQQKIIDMQNPVARKQYPTSGAETRETRRGHGYEATVVQEERSNPYGPYIPPAGKGKKGS